MKKTNKKIDAIQLHSLLTAICSGNYFVYNLPFVHNGIFYYIATGVLAVVCDVLLCFIFIKILKVIFKTIYIKNDWKNFWIMFIINMVCWFCSLMIATIINFPYILYIVYALFIILAIQIHNTIAKNSEIKNNS